MYINGIDKYYVMRLEKGEEIITSLREAFRLMKLKGAFFFGIGVGKNLVLGYFDAHKKYYTRKVFEGEYEFTSLSGNISQLKKEIVVHCHVTITNDNFNAFGGHLFQGTVPATCEILLLPLPKSLKRKRDKMTGLNLIDV